MITRRIRADFAARSPHLIAYDTPDPRRRRRFVRAILAFGLRVQKSVFVAWLSAGQESVLRDRLRIAASTAEDTVLVVRLARGVEHDADLALATFPEPPAPLIV